MYALSAWWREALATYSHKRKGGWMTQIEPPILGRLPSRYVPLTHPPTHPQEKRRMK